jgi:hypothetical protein
MFGKSSREELRQTIRIQADRIARLERGLSSLGNAATVAARALGKVDSAEIAGLRQQIAQKERTIPLLHRQVDAATGLDRPLVERKGAVS